MKYSQTIGIAAIMLLAVSCYLPWAVIPGKNIIVSGLAAEGTSFGKPGLMNMLIGGCMLLFFIIPKIWAKRMNVFFAAFNMAWAIRNFIIISACMGGVCPEKKIGLYLLVLANTIALVMTFFPNVRITKK